uniref:DUF3398 domain-containing protein n=1 Tax=Ascaris lumbricoides TaxID=6252 RepID=A0A0M3HQS2_ASCLU
MFFLDEDEPTVGIDQSSRPDSPNEQSLAKDPTEDFTALYEGHSQSAIAAQRGVLSRATTLPVDIPSAHSFTADDEFSIVSAEDVVLGDEKTEDELLLQRMQEKIFHKMQIHALSIRPPDDPERLFGERPWQRRYQNQAVFSTERIPSQYDDAVVVVTNKFS